MKVSDYLKSWYSHVCCCFPSYWDSYISINARRYQIQRLLDESDLSSLYLLKNVNEDEDEAEERVSLLVLKRIICPFGDIESVSDALREIDNYKMFNSTYLIRSIDSQVIQERDGSKTVLILLPYYPLGSLQDLIDKHLLYGTRVSENECVRILIGICKGLLCLHDPTMRETVNPLRHIDSVSMSYSDNYASLLEDTPLEMDLLSCNSLNLVSYVHLNIKPLTILFSADGLPVITEMGSCCKAGKKISDKYKLNSMREWVKDNCEVAYSAPELLNLTLDSKINCASDIWSVGVTLYNLLFGITPFEREEQLEGVPIPYAIEKGIFSFPDESTYTTDILSIIKSCLCVDPNARPSVTELIEQLQDLQNR